MGVSLLPLTLYSEKLSLFYVIFILTSFGSEQLLAASVLTRRLATTCRCCCCAAETLPPGRLRLARPLGGSPQKGADPRLISESCCRCLLFTSLRSEDVVIVPRQFSRFRLRYPRVVC